MTHHGGLPFGGYSVVQLEPVKPSSKAEAILYVADRVEEIQRLVAKVDALRGEILRNADGVISASEIDKIIFMHSTQK